MTPALAQQQAGRPPSRFFEIVDRIASNLDPRMERAFRRAVEETASNVDLERLERALRRRDVQGVIQTIGLTELSRRLKGSAFTEAIRTAIGETGSASAEQVSRQVGVEFDFDLTNPKAVIAAREQSARLVTQVTEESRDAIREFVEGSFRDGVPPERLARQIRSVVGLTSRQQGWVQNMRRDLESLQTATEDEVDELVNRITSRRLDAATMQRVRSKALRDEVTDEFVDEVVDRYGQSMLNFRSTNIARTETIDAANRGQMESWREAMDEGLLQRERTQRVWITTADDRTCPICLPMAGQKRGMDEPFMSPFSGAKAMHPPIHPMGRCAIALSFDD